MVDYGVASMKYMDQLVMKHRINSAVRKALKCRVWLMILTTSLSVHLNPIFRESGPHTHYLSHTDYD